MLLHEKFSPLNWISATLLFFHQKIHEFAKFSQNNLNRAVRIIRGPEEDNTENQWTMSFSVKFLHLLDFVSCCWHKSIILWWRLYCNCLFVSSFAHSDCFVNCLNSVFKSIHSFKRVDKNIKLKFKNVDFNFLLGKNHWWLSALNIFAPFRVKLNPTGEIF